MEEHAHPFYIDQYQFIFIFLYLPVNATSEGLVLSFTHLEEPAITHAILSNHFIREFTVLRPDFKYKGRES